MTGLGDLFPLPQFIQVGAKLLWIWSIIWSYKMLPLLLKPKPTT